MCPLRNVKLAINKTKQLENMSDFRIKYTEYGEKLNNRKILKNIKHIHTAYNIDTPEIDSDNIHRFPTCGSSIATKFGCAQHQRLVQDCKIMHALEKYGLKIPYYWARNHMGGGARKMILINIYNFTANMLML